MIPVTPRRGLALVLSCAIVVVGTEDFVGWQGETYDPLKTWSDSGVVIHARTGVVEEELQISFTADEGTEVVENSKQDTKEVVSEQQSVEASPEKISHQDPWIEQLSWKPRAFLYHGFLTPEECEHIIKIARPHLRRSTVVGEEGEDRVDTIRTSYGVFIPRLVDDVVTHISERVSNWSHVPFTHQEDVNVLRYSESQKYGAHMDVIDEDNKRLATVLMYLSDVEEGGETAFPDSNEWIDLQRAADLNKVSECANGHLAVKPKKGDALLFFSLTPNGETDDAALHTGCPVIKGVKWTATIWMHNEPFRPDELDSPPNEIGADPEDCEDVSALCPVWSKNGDCKINSEYMSTECALSCGLCQQCEEHDQECHRENRRKKGFPKIEDVY